MIVCILCSGCKTWDYFLRKEKAPPVIQTTDKQSESGTLWVNAKTKKVWINPHVDEEGNMVEGHYKYIVLEQGHWALQDMAPESKDENTKQ